MSAGSFKNNLYQENNNPANIHRLVTQVETELLTLDGENNTPPAGPANQTAFMTTSKNKKAHGKSPMKVPVRFTGAVPDGYKPGGVTSIPLLNAAIQAKVKAAKGRGIVGSYLGNPVITAGWQDESIV